MQTRVINVAGVKIGGGNPFCLIAGPCVIEGADKCFDVARMVKMAAASVGVPLIFKASFDKANRSSLNSYRGPGLKEGLAILGAIKRDLKIPVLTDVHDVAQAEAAAEVVDVIQIPAFLCRQTDLLIAAGRTGKPINVKKGQFMAPGDMRNVVDKIRAADNEDIILTERGTTFGYNYLVNDMRALPAMRMLGYPVTFDATHSVQTPGAQGSKSGGERQFIAPLARAAVAAGVDGLFIETHPDPDRALSDASTMLRTDDLAPLLQVLLRIDAAVREAIAAERVSEAARVLTGRTLVNAGLPPKNP